MTKKIYFYPFSLDGNTYVDLQLATLRQMCSDIAPVNRSSLWHQITKRRDTVAILNWFDDKLAWYGDHPTKTLIKSILMLAALRFRSNQIIWVRHNLWPHGLARPCLRQELLLWGMRLLTTTVVCHRKYGVRRATYIPHPLYFEGNLQNTLRDIEFFYFGAIKRYKGLEELLATWPPNRRLVIAGAAADEQVLDSLRELIRARALDIELVDRFLLEDELNAYLRRSKYVVLPHLNDTMIVSGAFYHAASFGCNLILRQGTFASFVAREFTFVNSFDPPDLDAVLSDIKYVDPDQVTEEVRQTNGARQCKSAWEQILFRREL
ncbi:MAG: hypothetical protein ABSF50_21385 [Burkholderiaceae bacterium]